LEYLVWGEPKSWIETLTLGQ